MHQRDTTKTMSYFRTYTESKINRNANLRHSAAETVDDAHRASLLYVIYKNELELWIAKYSAGTDIKVLRNDFTQVIDALEAYLQQPGSEPMDLSVLEKYIPPLWLVSIAYLLNVDDHLFNRIISLIGQNNKDGIIDRVIKLKIPEYTAATTIFHPEPYLPLYSALFTEGEEQKQLLRQFIETYLRIKEVYWIDTGPEKANYFGQWFFELAALAKGKLIEERHLVHYSHYPKDLV